MPARKLPGASVFRPVAAKALQEGNPCRAFGAGCERHQGVPRPGWADPAALADRRLVRPFEAAFDAWSGRCWSSACPAAVRQPRKSTLTATRSRSPTERTPLSDRVASTIVDSDVDRNSSASASASMSSAISPRDCPSREQRREQRVGALETVSMCADEQTCVQRQHPGEFWITVEAVGEASRHLADALGDRPIRVGDVMFEVCGAFVDEIERDRLEHRLLRREVVEERRLTDAKSGGDVLYAASARSPGPGTGRAPCSRSRPEWPASFLLAAPCAPLSCVT